MGSNLKVGTKFDEFQKIDYAIRKVLNKQQLSTNISAVRLKKKYQEIYFQLIKLQEECKKQRYSAFMLTIEFFTEAENWESISNMYRYGIGVEQDDQKADEYYAKMEEYKLLMNI